MGSMSMQKKYYTPSRGNSKCESGGIVKYEPNEAATKKEVDLQLSLLSFAITDEPASYDSLSVFLREDIRDVSNVSNVPNLDMSGNFYMGDPFSVQDPQPMQVESTHPVWSSVFQEQFCLDAQQHQQQQQQQQLAHPQQHFQPQSFYSLFPSPLFTSSPEMPSTLSPQPLPFQSLNANTYPQMVDAAPASSPISYVPSPMVYSAPSPSTFSPPSPDTYSSSSTGYSSPTSNGYPSPTSMDYSSPSLTASSSTRPVPRRKPTRNMPHYMHPTTTASYKARPPKPTRRRSRNTDVPENREIFKCDKCPKSFDRRYNFVQHHKTHSEIKDFRCDFPNCDSAFHRKADMLRHRLRHTGELPIECPFCTVRFRRVEAQKRHCQQEHRDAYAQYLEHKRQQRENRRAEKKGGPRC